MDHFPVLRRSGEYGNSTFGVFTTHKSAIISEGAQPILSAILRERAEAIMGRLLLQPSYTINFTPCPFIVYMPHSMSCRPDPRINELLYMTTQYQRDIHHYRHRVCPGFPVLQSPSIQRIARVLLRFEKLAQLRHWSAHLINGLLILPLFSAASFP